MAIVEARLFRGRIADFAVWLTLSVAAFSSMSPASATNVKLQVVGHHDTAVAGAIVALKQGLFAKEGLNVSIEHSAANADHGSDIVIRLQNAYEFLIARANGVPVVAIAGNFLDSSVTFYFRHDRRIYSAADLAGKSVGYNSASDTGLVFEWFLAKNSVSRADITERLSSPALKDILENTLDVFIGHAGIDDFALRRAGISFEVLDPRQYGVHALGTVFVTDEVNVRENPGALVAFLRALVSGWELAYTNIDQTVSMIAPTTSAAASEREMLGYRLEKEREYLRPGGERFGDIPRNRWNDLYTFMLQRRLVKGPIDLPRATDAKLISEAYRVHVNARIPN